MAIDLIVFTLKLWLPKYVFGNVSLIFKKKLINKRKYRKIDITRIEKNRLN